MGENRLTKVVMGLDLGKKRDYSALCAVEQWQEYWPWPYEGEENGESYYHLQYLERFPLDTDYPVQLEKTRLIFEDAKEGYKDQSVKPQLIIDATGPGIPMLDYFKKEIPWALGCYITGGTHVSREKGCYFVPKQHLASTLEIIFQNRRIKIAKNIPDGETLKNELMNFRYKTNPETGHASFEHWRERDHDDCVLSIAIALWYAENYRKKVKAVKSLPGM